MKRRHFLSGSGALMVFRPITASGESETRIGHVGARNLITDVAGLMVGQAQDQTACTGVTVILPDQRAVAAVDVRGGGPGTRETDALGAPNLVRSADAIVLSGGSVYGLASADGVATWLGARGRGFELVHQKGIPPSPIVPTAILFDLASGGNKMWGENPPYRNLGREAVSRVGLDFALGTAGAGYGATAGSLKGGIGSASYVTRDEMTIGAIVAVNSLGSVTAPDEKRFWAGSLEIGSEFGNLGPVATRAEGEDWGRAKVNPEPRANTTIACIATDVALEPDELKRIAIMAQDGLARAIRPVHAPFDGDVVFALSTSKKRLPLSDNPLSRPLVVARLGSLAADTLSRAIARAVYNARTPAGMNAPSWSSL